MRTPYLFKTDCGCIVREDSLVFCQLHGAAPDLLEACKVARKLISVACGEEAPFVKIGLEHIDKAIAKAERGEGK